METIHETARIVTSKPVQRAVVNSVLVVSVAATLFCLAGIASALFFQNFVPDQVVSIPVHLQYGSSLNPYGIVSLMSPPMKSQQEYDISVTLSMPRSPANVERGNFMVRLHLLDAPADGSLEASARKHAHTRESFADGSVVFSSRRPVLFPYVDPVVSLASRILFLFYHMFVPGSNTCTVIVPLAERVFFPRGSIVPASAYIEVEAGQTVQVYHATLSFTAQLRGLRWLMFHYRLPTYLAFTLLFWVCELIFMSMAWAGWSAIVSSELANRGYGLHANSSKAARIRGEGEQGRDESDVPQTFPTYGKQPRLKYDPEVKEETVEESLISISEVPIAGAEADDEDEYEEDQGDDGRTKDSGIGTSYSEEGAGSVRRRASRSLLQR